MRQASRCIQSFLASLLQNTLPTKRDRSRLYLCLCVVFALDSYCYINSDFAKCLESACEKKEEEKKVKLRIFC